MLLLLDLSAAFDTVDHGILLNRLTSCFGIKNRALFLHPNFKSDISLSLLTVSILVNVNCYMVYHKVLSWGPILYSMYTYLHGNIVRRYDMSLHFYLSFESTVPSVLIASKIEACIMDIDKWMAANKLMLNTDKMELLLSGS